MNGKEHLVEPKEKISICGYLLMTFLVCLWGVINLLPFILAGIVAAVVVLALL